MRQLWRYMHTAMRLVLRRPIVGVNVIATLPDGRLVLGRRVDNDQWIVPGGLLDWGESVEQAARRELAEETGLTLLRVERLVGVYSSLERDPRMHAVSIAIAATVDGEPKIQDSLEIRELRTFTVDDLPADRLAFDTRQQIEDYLSGRTYVR